MAFRILFFIMFIICSYQIGSILLRIFFMIRDEIRKVYKVLSPFLISMLVYFLYFYFVKGMRFKEGDYSYVGYGSKIKRLFIEFPRQFILDLFNRDPDEFKDYGVHIIAGRQGSGKSITLTYLLLRYQQMYPKAKVATNYFYKYQDKAINHWKDIIDYLNDKYGVIVVLDEIQNWFNSLQSKDFPPEMLTEITQQRKQRKVIFGTSQVFSRVAKPIREQTYMLYEPTTIFGCITFVRKYDVSTNTDGLTDTKKYRGCFFFIQNEQLRNSFDTYLKVENLSNVGFKEETYQIRNVDNTVVISSSKWKKQQK